MPRNFTYEKSSSDDLATIDVTCATDVTDTRLAYRLSDTSNEIAVVCGDDELCEGFPNKEAKAGESFKLRRKGHFIVVASGSGFASANNIPWTTAAAGAIRAAVPGTDKVQGYSKSIGAAAAEITVGIRD